ncbi:glutaredoxin domain-containing protein [Agilicoccus flavus]|uniref:glutaredoxin domain-containing protein n=1 Tax=Agilicoccus flavus TaxID=2775968 RepID=UPI001CF6BB12|nr:glutaredoxin domain-containing protein [Agilicoccus flavus]
MSEHPIVPAPGTLTVYATTWCPYCARLLGRTSAADLPTRVVDVERDPAAAAWVESVNHGNRVVPTVVFADGGVETNPDPDEALRRA